MWPGFQDILVMKVLFLPPIDNIMPPAPGNFILELVKPLADDNHHLGHDFVTQLRIIFKQLKQAIPRDSDRFAAA